MKIILIGYSGHGKVVADAIFLNNIHLKKYLDIEEKKHNPHNLQFFGNDNDENIKSLISNGYKFIISVGDNLIRHKIFKKITNLGANCQTIIHPNAFISETTEIGNGNFISSNVSINSSSKILDNCIINTSAIIEHDCLIKSSAHVAPGCIICGNVQIGEGSFIGANSTVKEGVKIGNNVIIGAGSLILNDIPDNAKCYGNPVKL